MGAGTTLELGEVEGEALDISENNCFQSLQESHFPSQLERVGEEGQQQTRRDRDPTELRPLLNTLDSRW